jgi:hypothetical protein
MYDRVCKDDHKWLSRVHGHVTKLRHHHHD